MLQNSLQLRTVVTGTLQRIAKRGVTATASGQDGQTADAADGYGRNAPHYLKDILLRILSFRLHLKANVNNLYTPPRLTDFNWNFNVYANICKIIHKKCDWQLKNCKNQLRDTGVSVETPVGIIDGSVITAVGLLLGFSVAAQIPDLLSAVRNCQYIC